MQSSTLVTIEVVFTPGLLRSTSSPLPLPSPPLLPPPYLSMPKAHPKDLGPITFTSDDKRSKSELEARKLFGSSSCLQKAYIQQKGT